MNDFSKSYLAQFNHIDGFIFKEGLPSCGNRDIKVYSGIEVQTIRKNGGDFFTKDALEIHPEFIIETSGRLNNLKIRDSF